MPVNVNNLQFYSGYPIDKIVAEGTVTDTVGIATSPLATTKLVTIANPYGKKSLSTASYTIDGANYYSFNTTQVYYNGAFGPLAKVTVLVGVSDNNIYFNIYNYDRATGYTVTINYAVYSIS